MPKQSHRRPQVWAAALLASSLAGAQWALAAGVAPGTAAANSELDAPLFYQLLVGELELRTGQPGVAYQVLLDAARRTRDEALFQRVVNIAMQARAGDQALIAAKAWREAVPASLEAHQMVVQLLALLNRAGDVPAALRALLDITPEAQRAGVLASLPRLFLHAAEPKRVYEALAPVLQDAAGRTETRIVALIVQARLALTAGESAKALELTQTVAAEAPQADDTLQLALELLPRQPEAEKIIVTRLQAQPQSHLLRLAYGRALARSQRLVEAAREIRLVTEQSPGTQQAWLALGSLELDLRHPEAAEAALREFIKRLDAPPAVVPGAEAAAAAGADTHREARQQAWLLLAQAAEMRGDLKGAEALLARIDDPQRALELNFRRASLLQRQGKLEQGLQLIRAMPEKRDEDARAKLMAESQLLRDARDWKAAHAVLVRANERFAGDTDLLYEQSMMAEKLGRLDEMETLLKRVTELKPEHYHAYNALGYSLADRNVRLDEARGLIEKALSFAPAEPFILDSMGWVEFRLGHRSEALRLLRQAYVSRPDADIAAHLGEVLWTGGELDEARRIWREGAQRDPKSEALSETLMRLKVKP